MQDVKARTDTEREEANAFPMNAGAKRIQEVYPRYSAALLKAFGRDYLDEAESYLCQTGRSHYRLRDSFSHVPLSTETRIRIQGRKLVCMSLFFRPSNFARRERAPMVGSDGQILMEDLERARHPIFEGSPRHARTFIENYVRKSSESDFGDWLPVVFLAEDLLALEPMLLDRGWIVIRMRHGGVGHNPGALWRFLGFNLDCRLCCIRDTDSPFNRHWADCMAAALEDNPKAALVRQIQATGPGGEMALILGGCSTVRPSRIDFDAKEMLMGYIVLNILHEDRVTNFVHEPQRGRDDSKITPLSKRRTRSHQGPLPGERVPHKLYPFYGFDEQWLKEFAYYHLSDGRIVTLLVREPSATDRLQQLDMQHQKENGNIILHVRTGKGPLLRPAN